MKEEGKEPVPGGIGSQALAISEWQNGSNHGATTTAHRKIFLVKYFLSLLKYPFD